MSLINCLNKLGKAVDKDDADFMRERFNRYTEKGMDETAAAQNAMKDFTDKVDVELDGIVKQVEKAGGKVSREAVEQKPMFIFDGDELVNANDVMKSLDDEITALDDIVRCAYK
jgi:hypothetical protein